MKSNFSYLILTLPAISLSCGCAAAITLIGFLVVVVVRIGVAADIGTLSYVAGVNGRTRTGTCCWPCGGTGDGELFAWPFEFFGILFGITCGRIVFFGGNSSRTVPGRIDSSLSGDLRVKNWLVVCIDTLYTTLGEMLTLIDTFV